MQLFRGTRKMKNIYTRRARGGVGSRTEFRPPRAIPKNVRFGRKLPHLIRSFANETSRQTRKRENGKLKRRRARCGRTSGRIPHVVGSTPERPIWPKSDPSVLAIHTGRFSETRKLEKPDCRSWAGIRIHSPHPPDLPRNCRLGRDLARRMW